MEVHINGLYPGSRCRIYSGNNLLFEENADDNGYISTNLELPGKIRNESLRLTSSLPGAIEPLSEVIKIDRLGIFHVANPVLDTSYVSDQGEYSTPENLLNPSASAKQMANIYRAARQELMSLDTPRKKKRRDKLVKKFAEDWEIYFSSGPKLKYKRKKGLRGLWQNFFGRKHSIFAMYWFFKQERLKNENIRKFSFPLEHDNMPVKDVPFKYKLQGPWDLDDEDLKFLYGGPLIDQNLEVLVQADTRLNRWIRFCKVATPPVALLSTIIGMLIKLPSLLELFQNIFGN